MHRMAHVTVAKAIGVSAVQVSRIRSGQQGPSVATMRRIQEAFDWPLTEQAVILAVSGRKQYARSFETILTRKANQK